jgi:predicted Zn-ribbon and HTH transcriptional regulator
MCFVIERYARCKYCGYETPLATDESVDELEECPFCGVIAWREMPLEPDWDSILKEMSH